jgi:glycosyltransferase involved in cell wall biosynthesis
MKQILQQIGSSSMTVHPILFYDENSPFSYDHESLLQKGLGGVEGSVIRIAEKLGETKPVVVAIKKRSTVSSSKNVHYMPITSFLLTLDWHAIVVLRSLGAALRIRAVNPKVPIWLWLHDFIKIDHFLHLQEMVEGNIGAIVISDFQAKLLSDLFLLDPYFKAPPYQRIYNPIDDDLIPDRTPVDNYKLHFSSSPSKGLKDTLEGFRKLHQIDSNFRLYVTNPGYLRHENPSQEGVIFSMLNHRDNTQLMRESLALFQLNSVYPETFGLVLAEANAVGTPILTHPLGAAPEILVNKEQLINTRDTEAVIERILKWKKDRPEVRLDDKFRLSRVIQDWTRVLQIGS